MKKQIHTCGNCSMCLGVFNLCNCAEGGTPTEYKDIEGNTLFSHDSDQPACKDWLNTEWGWLEEDE